MPVAPPTELRRLSSFNAHVQGTAGFGVRANPQSAVAPAIFLRSPDRKRASLKFAYSNFVGSFVMSPLIP